jgi:hypothetical protein
MVSHPSNPFDRCPQCPYYRFYYRRLRSVVNNCDRLRVTRMILHVGSRRAISSTGKAGPRGASGQHRSNLRPSLPGPSPGSRVVAHGRGQRGATPCRQPLLGCARQPTIVRASTPEHTTTQTADRRLSAHRPSVGTVTPEQA